MPDESPCARGHDWQVTRTWDEYDVRQPSKGEGQLWTRKCGEAKCRNCPATDTFCGEWSRA